ncbi:DUF397 domain-containing protein [Streptomyces sp. SID3343]|uniref:DUF397 domain-containing protein n=1 Tax=Streptomyces sp. SID3343 TaxID=2690260 RepID=UPI0013721186|nr:DUF397 domain-containing protein [Streptomyces sp. SID3343]
MSGAPWRKPTRSEGSDNCVESAALAETAVLRDTKDRERGYLTVDGNAWSAFVTAIKG